MMQSFNDWTSDHGVQGDVEEFSRILGAYNHDIGTQGRMGLFSAHKTAEDVCMHLLNALYGWSLVNTNIPGRNEEAVDLVDDANRIVVQVTATCSSSKINRTLDSANATKYFERGYRLKFAFVGFQHDAKKVQGTGRDAWVLHNPHGSDFFDPLIDTIFSANLVARFEGLEPVSRTRVLDLARGDIGVVQYAGMSDVGADADEGFLRRMAAEIVRQKKTHPSFGFIKGHADGRLHARGRLRLLAEDVVLDLESRDWVASATGETISLRKFFQDSWSKGVQNHVLVTGKGGIGKTVALLTFATEPGFLPEGVPAAYVPLRDLARYSGHDEGHLEAYLRSSLEGDYDRFLALSKMGWEGGPRTILLLDGFNEVPKEMRPDIAHEVCRWATKWSGTQIVTASRIRPLVGMPSTRWIELQGLTPCAIKGYLQSRGLPVPPRLSSPVEDGFWELADTPLMLRIYADVEVFRRLANVRWLRMRDPVNAGSLVWNYAQMELHGCVERRKGKYEGIEYAYAILLALPYVCWRMEASQSFSVGRDRLHDYIEDAARYWAGRNKPTYFRHMCWDLSGEVGSAIVKAVYEILADETCLLVWGDDATFALMHQNFRDGLAAIHVRNVVDVCGRGLPDVLITRMSERVKGYVADLYAGDNDASLLQAWEANRALRPTSQASTNNLLGILYRLKQGNLSELNWSGMDLRGISLYGYRNGMALGLSTEPEKYVKTKLDIWCFKPIGHSAAVETIHFNWDGKTIASGSRDGTIRIWNSSTCEQIGLPIHVGGGDVKSVYFSPNGKLLASGSADGFIRLWDVTTRRQVGRSMGGGGGAVCSVCFSATGLLLASGSHDGSIRIWDPMTFEQVGVTMNGHGGPVRSVSFSPDDQLVAEGSTEGFIALSRFAAAFPSSA